MLFFYYDELMPALLCKLMKQMFHKTIDSLDLLMEMIVLVIPGLVMLLKDAFSVTNS